MIKNKKKPLNKVFTKFRPLILSRHGSHSPLREKGALGYFPFRSVVRLGSTTNAEADRIECNSIEGVRNSANKFRMKNCFTNEKVKTADWWVKNNEGSFVKENNPNNITNISQLPYPIIAKHIYGSRGTGNYKLDTQQELETWMRDKDMNNYILEVFVKYFREYRLHITEDGCFYTCRKLLKNDAPEGTWQKHDSVCSWALESNPTFKKPNNWNLIVEDCVKALKSLKLDIGAFDVMVQGSKNGEERDNPKWNICESASAPSFGEITLQKYKEQIPKILMKKYELQH